MEVVLLVNVVATPLLPVIAIAMAMSKTRLAYVGDPAPLMRMRTECVMMWTLVWASMMPVGCVTATA